MSHGPDALTGEGRPLGDPHLADDGCCLCDCVACSAGRDYCICPDCNASACGFHEKRTS